MLSNLTSVVKDSIRVWADFNWWISEFGFEFAVVSSGLLDCLRTLLRDQTDRSSYIKGDLEVVANLMALDGQRDHGLFICDGCI